MDRTLVLVKPDGVQRGLIGEVISRLENRGIKLVALKLLQIDANLAGQHYAEHVERPFFRGLVDFITSSPVAAMVREADNVASLVRQTMGETDPLKSPPGTLRGDLGINIGRNLVHGSDSPDSAQREIDLFFDHSEILSYDRNSDPWITES